MKPIKRILMATDFSAGADVAAAAAGQLARQLNASVEVMTAVDTSPLEAATATTVQLPPISAVRLDEVAGTVEIAH